jgi:acyl carrier protein phosphodiesterase
LNFLAHLRLAGNDEDLLLGAMLGDFVRGKEELGKFTAGVQSGIMLHRHIDVQTDSLPAITGLLEWLEPPFRRYGGIIIDLACDHELALRWDEYSEISLPEFDRGVREMLARHQSLLPERLTQFMRYADRRGLFASYKNESEILHSLRGVGRRLSRDNPLHRVDEIWAEFNPRVAACFASIFREIQSDVAEWLKSRSTITGS